MMQASSDINNFALRSIAFSKRGVSRSEWLRASPAVWQIELPSLIFGKNIKNTPPTVWQKI